MAITFDTLKFANRLKHAGISPKHAEAKAVALADAIGVSELVTKQELQIELAPLPADLLLLKWMVGAMLACVLSRVIKAFF